ncbi:MAG: bifunctional sugar-1-phosphate nucleotidylyltransferase/acetyltransferase [Thermoplasmata archaeon]
MQAVILAAGAGKRLWPFSEDVPKPMLQIANKPIMEYIIEALVENNIRDIIIVVGYKKERILSYFKDGKQWNATIKYVVQNQQLGTAHALYQAKNQIKNEFIVLSGDNIILSSAISAIKEIDKNAILLTESDEPSQYGVAYVSGKILKTIVEKPVIPDYNIISTSVIKFTPEIFEDIEKCLAVSKYNLGDLISECAGKREIHAITLSNVWKDVIYPWSIIETNALVCRLIRECVAGEIDNMAVIRGKVTIGKDTIIHPGTYITGPAVIGSGCEIGPSVVISPYTSIGNNVRISPFTIIENSVIMDNAAIGPHSTIQSSVLGEGTTIESELRAISGNATIEVDEQIHRVPHIGAIVGARCNIQHGVFLNPGTIIGNDCKIYANTMVSGKIPSKTVVM